MNEYQKRALAAANNARTDKTTAPLTEADVFDRANGDVVILGTEGMIVATTAGHLSVYEFSDRVLMVPLAGSPAAETRGMTHASREAELHARDSHG